MHIYFLPYCYLPAIGSSSYAMLSHLRHLMLRDGDATTIIAAAVVLSLPWLEIYSSNNRFSESTTESSGGTQQQPSRLRYVSLKKPMGLILEELDSSPADDDTTNSEDGCFFVGTKIVDMAPGGSAATASQDVCIGDKIMAVNDQDVSGANLEQVMECILRLILLLQGWYD